MRDLAQPPKLLPGGGLPGKLVVVENVYHYRPHEEPKGAEARFMRWLSTDAKGAEDEGDATPEWTELQFGRVKVVGQLVLLNRAGEDFQAVPTEEQRRIVTESVIEVRLEPPGTTPGADAMPHLVVRPGETSRYEPAPGIRAWVRCRAGNRLAPFKAAAYPS